MPTAKKTRARGEARRREILDVALDLFSERGFNAVSLADIAATVGITQAGVLHHFRTKADLLLAALQERERRNAANDLERRENGMTYLEAYLDQLRVNEERPPLIQLFALLSAESLTLDHPGHDWFAERYAKIDERVTAELEKILDSAKLPPGLTVRIVAQWLIGLPDGLRIQWLLDPDSMVRHESVRLFVELLKPYMRETPQR